MTAVAQPYLSPNMPFYIDDSNVDCVDQCDISKPRRRRTLYRCSRCKRNFLYRGACDRHQTQSQTPCFQQRYISMGENDFDEKHYKVIVIDFDATRRSMIERVIDESTLPFKVELPPPDTPTKCVKRARIVQVANKAVQCWRQRSPAILGADYRNLISPMKPQQCMQNIESWSVGIKKSTESVVEETLNSSFVQPKVKSDSAPGTYFKPVAFGKRRLPPILLQRYVSPPSLSLIENQPSKTGVSGFIEHIELPDNLDLLPVKVEADNSTTSMTEQTDLGSVIVDALSLF